MQNNNFKIFYVQQNCAFFESSHHLSSLFLQEVCMLIWHSLWFGLSIFGGLFYDQILQVTLWILELPISNLNLNQEWMMTKSLEKVHMINWWWWYLLISDETSIDAACHLRVKEKIIMGKLKIECQTGMKLYINAEMVTKTNKLRIMIWKFVSQITDSL